MPWGMWDYPRTYTGLLRGAGVLHERLLSLRPPAGAPHFVNETTGEQELDQARCGRHEPCRRFYRAHSSLRLPPGRLCAPRSRDGRSFQRRRAPVPCCEHYRPVDDDTLMTSAPVKCRQIVRR